MGGSISLFLILTKNSILSL